MPTLPSQLPDSLSILGGTGLYTPSGVAYSYAIGGLPWLSAASREHPIIRETAPIRKQQFDSQQIPGEQSLEGWWLRSQQSFHGGAGQLFGDPTEDNPLSTVRFRDSRNINVWSQGIAKLLNAVGLANATAVPNMKDMTEFDYGDSTPAAFAVGGNTFVTVRGVGDATVTAPGPSTSMQSVTTDGTSIFVAAQDGVWSAPIPATSPGTWTWTKEYNVTTTSAVFMAFVKHRIMLAVGPAVYELTPHPPTPPAALPTAKYTSPDTNWSWTGITESANAIYIVGNNVVRGAILKFVLDTAGAIPTLTGGAIAAQLPSGEVPYSAIGYLGSFVGIGTNKGVRVGVSDAQGNIEYGPILFETDGPVKAWSARDRFLWCTVSRGSDGESGIYRIDLSVQVGTLRFPYAPDLVAVSDVTNCNVIAHVGSSDKIAFGTATDLYVEDPTKLATSGYLLTSRIRFSTLEPKLYKLVRVRGPVLEGPLAYITLDAQDNEAGSILYPEGKSPGDDDSAINSPSEPVDFISLKFVLTRDDIDLTKGGEFWAYQVKALPASPRQRLIQLPLWCFDWEADRNGQRVGGQGTAVQRLLALEDLERDGNSVTLQDLDVGINTQCVIERINFMQTTPPPSFEGWGGIATVTLRTIS